jgi:hypothetical protein
MKKLLPIPKEDQLRAAANGWKAIYELLSQYETGLNINALAYRAIFTITEGDLAEWFRHNPQLAQMHVLPDGAEEPYHEIPILKRKDSKYLVYANDHGEPRNTRKYKSLNEGAAAYIFYFW